MKVSVTKRILLAVLCLILLFSIAACSERKPEDLDSGIKTGEAKETEGDIENKIDAATAKKTISDTIRNKSLVQKNSGDEWIHIDIDFHYYYKNYLVVPNTVTDYRVVVKGNINIFDNDATQFFLEARDVPTGRLDLGLYYYRSIGYLVVGQDKFYLNELNMTELVLTLVDTFAAAGIDPTTLVSGIISGNTGIDVLDAGVSAASTILWEKDYKQTIADGGKTQIISAPLKLTWLLTNLNNKLVLAILSAALGQEVKEISWAAFGLPDIDRLLDQLLGFGLHSIIEKDWPIMNANLNAISTIMPVLGVRDYEDAFVSNGFSITIDTPIVIDKENPKNNQLQKEFDLDITVSPLKIGKEGDMVTIDFSRTPLGEETFGSVYSKGSLLNFETNLSFSVENEDNTIITLNDVLGQDLLDLGAVGQIPLKMPTATKYDFTLDAKVSLDFFDNTLNRAEILLTFQDEQFVRGYLIGDTLYLDMSALTDKYGRIVPDIKLSGIDITGALFSSETLLALFDPSYMRTTQPLPAPLNEEGDEEEGGLDIIALLEILLREDVLYLPGHKTGGNFVLTVDNTTLNEIMGMIAPGISLGFKGLRVESGTGSIPDLINRLDVSIELSDSFRAGFNINKFRVMYEPNFDFSAVDTQAKRESFTDIKDVTEFNAYLAGDFTLGLSPTQEGVIIGLDGIMAGITKKFLIDIGITVDNELRFEYEINANVDVKDLGNTELTIIVYIPEGASGLREKILHIYYTGQDDTVFIDLSSLHNLEQDIPLLSVLGPLPKFYIEDVGISDMLSGLFGSDSEMESDLEQALFNLMQEGISFEDEQGEGADPLEVIGSIIGDILIDNYQVNIILNTGMLTALMGLLGVELDMPDIVGSATLSIYKVDDGYVDVHLGILDSGNPELSVIDLDLCLIRQVAFLIGRRDIASDFDVTSFKPLDTLLENLNIAVEFEGMFAIDTQEDYYTNELFDSLLSGLIEDLALQLDLSDFKMYIGYTIRGNININDILASELEVVLYNCETPELNTNDTPLLIIYMKNRNLYLDLSFFGLPRLGITNIEALADGLSNANSLSFQEDSLADLLIQNQEPEDAIKIQLLINPSGLSVSLTGEIIGALLAMLGVDLPITFNYAEIEINTTADAGLSVGIGIEVFDVSFTVGNIYISIDSGDKHIIEVPRIGEYNMTDMGLPLGVYLEVQGYFYFTNEEPSTADLSPLLGQFLEDIDLNLFLEFLGIEDEEVYYSLKAYINLLDMENSRVSFALRKTRQGDSLLSVYYESGDLYIDTNLFNIGKVLLRDVGNIFTNSTPPDEYDEDFLNEEPIYNAKSFLDLIFSDGGLGLSITKDVLLTVFLMLGLDLEEALAELDFGVSAVFTIEPIHVDIGIEFTTAKFGLVLDALDIKWQYEGLIEPPVDAASYEVVTQLTKIGIELTGSFTLDVFGNSKGVRMDKILGALGMVSDIGILFQVLGDTFGGTVYYKIKANLDISNLSNIQLVLYLSSSPNAEDQGDILTFYIMGQPDGSIDIYIDAAVFNLEKIKIVNVSQVINMFTSSGATPLAVEGNINNSEDGSTALLPNIIVGISMQKHLQSSVFAVNVTTGAIYSLLSTLAGLDISGLVSEFPPEIEINIIDEAFLLQFVLEFQNLMAIELEIHEPSLTLSPANIYVESPNEYTEINDKFSTIKVSFGGEINLTAYPTDSDSEIDFSNLIMEFLHTTDFGVIIQNLDYLHSTIYYNVEASINIKEILAGNLAKAFKLKFIVTDVSGNLLIAAYLDDGTIYIDLSALNVGKVKIEDAFSLFGLVSVEDAEEILNQVRLLNEEQTPGESMASAYVTLQLSNENGIFVQIAQDTVVIMLNSFGLPGSLIVHTLNDIEGIITLNNEGFALGLNIAEYEFEFCFNRLEVNFKNNEVNIDINKDSYASLNELPNEIHASLNLTFNLDMSEGAEYDFTNLISTLISGGSLGFDIRPTLKILEQISSEYRLHIEAMLKINDILSSDIKLDLYAVGVDEPVLRLYYIEGTIYIDAEAFNIQKLRIADGVNFFTSLFVTDNPVPLGNMAPIDDSDQAGALASVINVTLSREGLVTHIGASALFAVLGVIGGISSDAQDLVTSIGDLHFDLSLFSPETLAEISVKLWASDETGQPREGYGIVFSVKVGYDFNINLAPEQKHLSTPLDYAAYVEIKEIAPIISIATTIDINLVAAKKEIPDIYGEPLSGFINSLITDLVFQIALNIEENQSAKIVLDIKAEFNPLDLTSLALQIEVKKDNKLYARISVMSGNLYIDLSFMGGSRMRMADVIDLIFSSSEEEPDNSIANQESNEEEIELPILSLLAQIQTNGLFVFAERQVFDILFSMLGLNEFTMMSNIHATVSLVPNADIKSVVVGAEIGIGDSSESDVFTLGVAINGLRVNFVRFGNDQLIKVNSTQFVDITDINIIKLETTLEFFLATETGSFEFKNLLAQLFDSEDLFGRALAPQLEIAQEIGDTIVVELKLLIPLDDIVNGLQVRAHIYSKSSEAFDLELIYWNSNLYLDGDKIGLSKIYGKNLINVLSGFLVQGQDEEDEPINAELYYMAWQELLNSDDPLLSDAAKVTFILSELNGLTIKVSTGMLIAALGLVGVDLTPYFDGLVKPGLEVNVSPALNFKIEIKLPSVTSEGSIDLGLMLIGQSTSFDTLYEVIVDTIAGPVTNVPPLISPEEREEYTDYSDMNIYLAFSVVVDIGLDEGRLDFSQLLHILADGINMGLDIREAHTVRLSIDIELGLAINKLISRDETEIDESVRLKGNIHYTIIDIDGGEFHSQTVLYIFNYGQELYVSLEVFGTEVKLKIPDFSIGGLINEMIDLSSFTEAYEEDRELNNAAYLLYNDNGVSNDLVIDLVLDKQGIAILITAEVIGALERLISSEELDMTGAIRSIIDEGRVGLFFDNGMYIGLEVSKEGDAAQNIAGYDLKILLLDGLVFDTNGKNEQKKYYHFFNSFQQDIESGMFNDYFFTDEIRDRVTVGLKIELTADLVHTLLDWSDLFDVQEVPTKFILEFLSDMYGTIIMEVLVDINIFGIAQLGLEAQVLLKDTSGEVLLALYYVGNLNKMAENAYQAALYLECEPLGIPKLKIGHPTLLNFLDFDIAKLVGYEDEDEQDENGPQNAEEDDSIGSIDITKLFDSISIAKGTVGIVVAHNVVASILSDLFGFNFADIGALELAVDMVEDEVVLDLALDIERNLAFRIGLSDFYIHLGTNNIFKNKDFNVYKDLNDYKLELTVESSLNVTDKLFSIFDMKALTAPLLNDIGIVLQAGDNLDMQLDFVLKVFIDFADLNLLKFELEVKLFDKIMARIIYIGEMNNGTIYLQLEGLGLPNMRLSGINLGELVKGLISNIGEEEDGEIIENAAPNIFNAEMSDDLSKLQSLLHFILDYEEVTLAITGALAVSLLGSVTDGMAFPEFDRFKIGYNKKDDLAGLLLILTQNGTTLEESFRIKYNFNAMHFNFATNAITTINYSKDSSGKTIIYQDISVINKIGLTLDAEITLKTKKPTGEKSPSITGLENLVAGLIGAPSNAIELDLQNSYLVYGLSLGLIVDLANLSNTKLSLDVTYNMRPLLSVYYIGETNTVYADLSGLGLFRASISGLDLMSLIGDLLTGFELIAPGEGLNVGGLIDGLLNAEGGGAIKRLPTIKIVLDNKNISILPNIEVIAALVPSLGGMLPPIALISAGMNFYAGLNNASVQVKLDTVGNDVFINVPQGGLRFAIGDAADGFTYVPSASALNKYGGIAGINLNANGMAMDTLGLVHSIYDSINLKRFVVYLEKRNYYWQQRSFSEAFETTQDYGVRVDPNSNEGFSDWGNYSDYDDYYVSPRDVPTGVNGYNRTKLMINRKTNNVLEVDFWQIDNKASRSGVYIQDSGLNLKLGTGLIWYLDVSMVFDLLPPPWNLLKHIIKPKIPIPIGEIVDRLGVLPSLMDLSIDSLIGDDEETKVELFNNVFGYVVDNVTGEPVAGAKVMVQQSGGKQYITYTNKDGAYAFLKLPEGKGYRLTITCPEQYYRKDESTTFNVAFYASNESYIYNDSIVIPTKKLIREDTAIYNDVHFHGRVVDHLGAPAVGVAIYVSKKEKTEFFYIGSTDEDGYYDLYADGLIGSKHYVMIGASSGVLFELGEDKFYVITQTNEKVDGFDVFRNYTLVLYDLYTNITFTGTVTDYFGALMPNTEVQLRDEVKGTITIGYTNDEARYTITVEAIQGLYHSIRAKKADYHTMAYTKKTVNSNNQTITHNLILNKIRNVEYKGVIKDDFGNPIQNANIRIDNIVVAQTNIMGEYGYTQSVDGLSKKIRAEKAGYFQPEDISKTIDGGMSEVVTNMTLYSIKNITFSGVVRDNSSNPIATATVYYNEEPVTTTNAFGEYSYTYVMPPGTIKEKDFKLEHSLRVAKDGYFDISKVNIISYKETGSVERDFVLEPINSGSIIGTLVDENGDPIASGVYIYFKIDGKTVIKDDTRGLEPIDFAKENYTTGAPQVGIDNAGNINIKGVPLNVNIVVKFRSTKYEYKNITLTRQLKKEKENNTYNLGVVVLTTKPIHWSQIDSNLDIGTIVRVRIRLGADIKDADYHNDDFGSGTFQLDQDRSVYNRLNKGIETGAADIYDDISYIEVWLDPMFINDLFGTIHNLMMEMMSIMAINPDSVVLPHDLIKKANVIFDDNDIPVGHIYNENDEELYNYKYPSYTYYLAAYKNGVNKIPSGVIGWGIGQAVESLGGIVKTAIGYAPYLLGDVLRQASAILAHIVPFQDAYSMIQTQGVTGNPLNVYSALLDPGDEDGLVDIGTRVVEREVNYFDLGAYVKISMDTSDPYQNTVQRISILLNGATYKNQKTTEWIFDGLNTREVTYVNHELAGNGDFTPDCTSVQKRDIVLNKVVNTANQDYMKNWIKYSVSNSYVIINEYDTDIDRTLLNQYFIYDNYGHQIYDSGHSLKDDAFQELDIDNNGIGLRVAKAIPDSFIRFDASKEDDREIDYNPPSEIIFNDPYNPSDFTFVGGTWAFTEGTGPENDRRATNKDYQKTPLDFLPNRAYVSFLDGTSFGNNGIAIIWDMTAIRFDPAGTDPSDPKDVYYLKGYALNQTYGKYGTEYTKIKCTIQPRLVDPAQAVELRELPEIDPLSFDEAKYLAHLPEMFHYDFDTNTGGYSYVFTNLVWDLSQTDFNYDSITANIKLTYSFPGVLPATIDVPVSVKNRTVINVNTEVPGSYNDSGIITESGNFQVRFDPFENTDPKASLATLTRLNVKTAAEDSFINWRIAEADLSELDVYDPHEYVQGPYSVYFWLADDFGKLQKITVEVLINSKEIIATSLQDQEFIPYGYQDGEPNRLLLPEDVTVYYADGTHQVIPVPISAWHVPAMSYTFDDFEPGSEGDVKDYSITTLLGIGESTQEVGFTVRVHKRELLSMEPLQLDSVTDLVLPARRLVKFFDGNSEIFEEVDIHWAISQEQVSSSFAGATYYSNVTINDDLFGQQTLKNVRITVSQTSINALLLPQEVSPEDKDIIPFIATTRINELLDKPGFKLAIEGSQQATLDQSLFDIVSWRYVNEGGIYLDGEQSWIVVKIGNKGYGAGNKIWTQEVFVDLSDYVLDVSTALVNDTLEIDPYDYTLPTALNVTLYDDSVVEDIPCLYDLSSIIETFFKTPSAVITKGITIGNGNNLLQFTLNVINTNPRAKISVDYGIDFENVEIKAFDTTFTLPLIAEVTFDTGETLTLPVEWLSVGDFGEQGGIVTGINKIGNNKFGYIDDLVYINIAPEQIISTTVPETITIDPYGASVNEQLLAQGLDITNIPVVTTEAGEQNPRVMNAPMPDINITFEGNGEGETIYFMVGLSWHLDKRIEKAIAVNVIVEERSAVGVIEKFEGTVYQHANLDEYDSLTILFQDGTQKILPISSWDTSNLRYTLIGGRYTVKAFFGTGQMFQGVDVEVIVKPSKLLSIGEMAMVGGQWVYQPIERLIVDPYEGFVDLPSTVYAQFQYATDPMAIKVDWAYSHIARVMSVNGDGSGLNSNYEGNMAAVATVYMQEDFSKTALQSLEVPVTVLNKEIKTIYVSKSIEGNDYVEYNSEVFIDPYAGPYSELFASEDFAYYRRVKLLLKDNTEKEFDLTAGSYRIFDNDTKVATNLNNLYTGRNVIVNMTFGASGGSIALDAMSTRTIDVTIYDMTYASGLPKDDFTIDVYGIRVGASFDTEVTFEQGQEFALKGIGTDEIEHTFAVTYDDKHINTQFKAELPVRIGSAINFNEGEGRLYATYGNEYGGYQIVNIPIYYLNRVADRLFDPEDTPYFGAFEPGSQQVGFVIDPFVFNKDTFIDAFPTSGSAQFTDQYGAISKVLDIDWDNTKAQKLFSIKGGITQVYGTIGSGVNAQRIEFLIKVLNRRVVNSVENESITGIIKSGAYQSGGVLYTGKLKPYRYLDSPDVPAQLNSDLFATDATFTINTVEGDPITYTYNRVATSQGALILDPEETNLIMAMQMDSGMPLSHRGGYLRFYLTMPGYASGKDGQQQVPLYIPMQEQYIKDVTVDDNTSQGVAIGWDEGGNLIQTSSTSWKIENPYYFIIKYGGLALPDNVLVKTGTAEGGVDDIYKMEVRWNNATRNMLNINYDDVLIETAFSVDLDGQSYGMTFECVPYILSNTLLFSILDKPFGIDEFIDLPENNARHSEVHNIINVDSNGNYIITFDNGKQVSFEGIGGSGNRFTFNKWDFSDVIFDDQADIQEATLRLGGIGGQLIRWELATCSKYIVNYSLQTLYVTALGQSFSLPDLNPDALPEKITQYFSDNTYKEFMVEYTQVIEPDMEYAVNFNPTTRVVTAHMKSPAVPNESAYGEGIAGFISGFQEPEGVASPGVIRWTPTTNRAYPSTEQETGETIFFSVYENKGDGNKNGTKNTYLRHPDDPDYGYVVAPGLGVDYKYLRKEEAPHGIYILDGYKSDCYFPPGQTQNVVPILQVKKGTRFDFRNLPVYDVYNEWTTGLIPYIDLIDHYQDFTYYMPWSTGSVRYLPSDLASAWSYTGSEETFGDNSAPENINTNEVGAVYTISTSIALGSVSYRLHCKIEIVNEIT